MCSCIHLSIHVRHPWEGEVSQGVVSGGWRKRFSVILCNSQQTGGSLGADPGVDGGLMKWFTP